MEKDYNAPVKLTLTFKGYNVYNEFDLRAMSCILYNFTGILDESYTVLSGDTRKSANRNENFLIKGTKVYPGSLNIDIIFQTLQLAQNMQGFCNPLSVWEYLKAAIDFLTQLVQFKLSGITPSVHVENGSLYINGDNNTVYVAPLVDRLSNQLQEPLHKITSVLDDNGISEFSAGNYSSENKSVISLTSKYKNAFKDISILNDVPISLIVSIIQLNKESLTGKLRVLSGQLIPDGIYPFCVKGVQSPDIYIKGLAKANVRISAQLEKKRMVNGTDKVSKIYIVNVFGL